MSCESRPATCHPHLKGRGASGLCSTCYRNAAPGRVERHRLYMLKSQKKRLATPEGRAVHHAHIRRRTARLAGLPHVPYDFEECKTLHNHRCAYCGEARPLTIDHIVPTSRGGGDTPNNILPACRSCNSRKNDRTYEEWVAGAPSPRRKKAA